MAKKKSTNGSEHIADEIRAATSEVDYGTHGELRTLDTAVLLDRLRFANQVGISFEGKRDMYATLGYPRIISAREYRERYSRGGIAKRIVEAYPKATWRGGVEIYEDEDPDKETEFEKAFKALDERLHVWAVLERADILAGLSTYSVILLGDGNKLDEPLQRGKPDDLLYMTPYFGGGGPGSATWRSIATDVDATIFEYEDDVKSPRFGEPRLYSLKRTNVSLPQEAQHVHWSRVIHIAEGCLDDNVFGIPVLENVWNLLDDLDKCTGGGAEAFWLRANAGMQLNVDKDMALQPGEYATVIDKLKADVEAYKHQLTRVLRTRGVDIKQLGSDVANFGPSADAILKQIAGSKGIPLRILTGSEQGQLASGQDAENWNSQVQDRRTNYAGPSIARRLVDRLIKYGYLPEPKQYTVGWPVEEEMTEPQKADLAVKLATANSTMGDPLFTEAEIREKCFDMKPLTDEQRKEITDRNAEKVKQQQEAMAAQQPAGGAAESDGDEKTDKKPAGKFPFPKAAEQLEALGGAGSGNFGHKGRPGEVGGSEKIGADALKGDMTEALAQTRGRWFASTLAGARDYGGQVHYVDIPEEDAAKSVTIQGQYTESVEGALHDEYVIASKYATQQKAWSKNAPAPAKGFVRIYRGSAPKKTLRGTAEHLEALGGAGSGNFAHAGRPGAIGGSQSGLNGLLARVGQPDSGFTYHAVTGYEPTEGYVLSIHKEREVVLDAKTLTLDALVDFTIDNKDLLDQPENFLGGWHDPVSGKLFLDVSTVVDRAEDAERLSREHQQFAYFDLKYGKSIPLLKAAGLYGDDKIRGRVVLDGFSGRQGPDARRPREALSEGDWTDADRGRAIARARTARQLSTLGGVGSGNFGHSGRPGAVGGSSSSGMGGGFAKERERVKAYHKMAGTEYRNKPIPLYHSTQDTFAENRPEFDAFYGTEDFQKNYPQEFGPNTYEVILPPDAAILDLNQPSEAASNFMKRAQLTAWPKEQPLDLNPSDPDFYDNWYEVWTDKNHLIPALKGTPYAGVKYNDEYLLPATTLKGLPARAYAPTTSPKRIADYAKGRAAETHDSYPEHPDAELLDVLAEAIAAQNTEVIDQIIGVTRAEPPRHVEPPRPAADIFIHLQQDPRALGGPGSGNFGHAGRPGAIGGSSSTGGAGALTTPLAPSIVPSGAVPIQDFRDAIHAKGWKTAEIGDLPHDIRMKLRTDLKLRQQNALSSDPTSVPPIMMEGVLQGLDDIEAKMPEAAAIMKAEVPILVAEYHPDVTATSIIKAGNVAPTDRDKWLLINTAPQPATANQGDKSFNVSQRIASTKTGDDFLREAYRNTMIHESAHIVDALTNHQLTKDTVASTLEIATKDGRLTVQSTEDMVKFLDQKVSTYAAMSGPMEAAAEIFTASIRDHKLPPELHALRDSMLKTDLSQRVRKH